jgi:hypothetical protein
MRDTTTALTCPKCGGTMRSYERNGIVIDQCADCRGVFLDRGELERLVEAEGAYYGAGPGAGVGAGAGAVGDRFEPRDRLRLDDRLGGRDRGFGLGDDVRPRDRYGRGRDDDDRWDDDDDGRGRRGGFLGGLLDFD